MLHRRNRWKPTGAVLPVGLGVWLAVAVGVGLGVAVGSGKKMLMGDGACKPAHECQMKIGEGAKRSMPKHCCYAMQYNGPHLATK